MTTYKRGNLIITDPERAKAIFSHAERPVQIVFAGKGHQLIPTGNGERGTGNSRKCPNLPW